jgi:choline dehydrogenase-like flavoprotein
VEHLSKVKAQTWKEVFASLNPSPVFEAVAVLAEVLAIDGIDNLRIADGSVMPRVTTGNTMAPCVIIGERAAEIVRAEHNL